MPLSAKHIISCCKNERAEISARKDIVVNIFINILKQRGLVSHEQRREDRKMVMTAKDEFTIGTENLRSDDWINKGRVS